MWEEVPWPGAHRIGTGLWGECQHPAFPAHSSGGIEVSVLHALSEMSACLMTRVLVLLPVSQGQVASGCLEQFSREPVSAWRWPWAVVRATKTSCRRESCLLSAQLGSSLRGV